MGGLLWTGILYAFTLSIVFITYRTFVSDRKADNEARSQEMINRVQGRTKAGSKEPAPAPAPVAPTVKRPAWQAAPVNRQRPRFPVAR
jgi:hypothetical protein